MMRCPKCGVKELVCKNCGATVKNPTAVAGGKAGGAAKVAKGFASPAVMRKALATRLRNQKACRHNITGHLRPDSRRDVK
jgi:hypothetical protein